MWYETREKKKREKKIETEKKKGKITIDVWFGVHVLEGKLA